MHEQIVNVAFQLGFIGAQTRRRIALRIEVDHEHSLPEHGKCRAEINRCGALSDAAFLIDERDDARQC
jgi:hypothetical protein